MRVVYALMLCIMGAFGAKLCYIGEEHRLLFDNRECEILYQSLDIDDSNPPPFNFSALYYAMILIFQKALLNAFLQESA